MKILKSRYAIALLAILLWGCGVADEEPDSEFDVSASALRISGPWAPPATTVAIAATQYVPVVDPPAVSPRGSCSSNNAFACSCRHPECSPAHPGTVDLDRFLRQRFPYLRSGGLYCCRQNSARTSVPKLSVHAVGRAIDLMVTLDGGDADNGLGDPVANWLVENAEFIGVQRVIWDRKYWNGERGFGNLSSNSLSHTNHLHIELSKAGASKQTPFFTSGASNGVCQARCEGTRIINADCTSGDCALYGATCTAGDPPTCTQPPPPEPPEAVRVSSAALPSMRLDGPPGRVNLFTPRRIFDTRVASTNVTRGDGSTNGPLSPSGENNFAITGLPSGSTGVWLNLAAVEPVSDGFLSVYPTDGFIPLTSNVNYLPGRAKSNAVPIHMGTGNSVTIQTLREVEVVADLTASFAPTGDGMDATLPTRILDTRGSAPIPQALPTEIDVRAPAGSTGVVATIAVINPGNVSGFLTAYPCGEPTPATSTINYAPEGVTANSVLSKLGPNRKLCVESTQEVDVIVDVAGYLSPDGPLSYQPLVSQRILDTRKDTSYYTNRLGNRQTIELPIQSLTNVPDGIWSVVTNVTAVDATQQGHLTAYPCGANVPNTSSLNFRPGEPSATLNVSRLGMNGRLCVFASSRVHLIVDVVGVWKHIAALQPTAPPLVTDGADEGDPVDPADPQIDDNQDLNNQYGGTNNTAGNYGTNGSSSEAVCATLQCGADEVCADGGCYSSCIADDDCGGAQICYEGGCYDVCNETGSCDDLDACYNGRCLNNNATPLNNGNNNGANNGGGNNGTDDGNSQASDPNFVDVEDGGCSTLPSSGPSALWLLVIGLVFGRVRRSQP